MIPGGQVQLHFAVAVIRAKVAGEEVGVQVAVAGVAGESVHQRQRTLESTILAKGNFSAGRDVKNRIALRIGGGENVVIRTHTHHAGDEKLGAIADGQKRSGIHNRAQGEPGEAQAGKIRFHWVSWSDIGARGNRSKKQTTDGILHELPPKGVSTDKSDELD